MIYNTYIDKKARFDLDYISNIVKYRRALTFLGNMCNLALFFLAEPHETIWWSLSLKNNILTKNQFIDTKAETI